jgi:hypothetical protein
VEDPYVNARFEIEFVKELAKEDESSELNSLWKALVTIKPIDPQ